MGLGLLVIESRDVLREWASGNNQLDTREKDFFFRSGGCERTIGRGGGGGSSLLDM